MGDAMIHTRQNLERSNGHFNLFIEQFCSILKIYRQIKTSAQGSITQLVASLPLSHTWTICWLVATESVVLIEILLCHAKVEGISRSLSSRTTNANAIKGSTPSGTIFLFFYLSSQSWQFSFASLHPPYSRHIRSLRSTDSWVSEVLENTKLTRA